MTFELDGGFDDGITMERWGDSQVAIPISVIYPSLTDEGKELLK